MWGDIYDLKNNSEIVILPVDKDSTTVIMDLEMYTDPNLSITS